MNPPNTILTALQEAFHAQKIEPLVPITGGSINQLHKIRLTKTHGPLKGRNEILDLVLKWKEGGTPNFLELEVEGLQYLSQKGGLRCPEVLWQSSLGNLQFFVMEFIQPDKPLNWEALAESLFELHQVRQDRFGWHKNNFMGLLAQDNSWEFTFPDFWWQRRLKPLIFQAKELGFLKSVEVKAEAIMEKLNHLFPARQGSLCHGDLWSGNYMAGPNGDSVFIDPAPAYGHREFDIAMSEMFGSCHSRFYARYFDLYKGEGGDWDVYQNRKDVLLLYPYLVHLILFGKSYESVSIQILKSIAD